MKLSYPRKLILVKIILISIIILIISVFILVPTISIYIKNNYSFASNLLINTLLKKEINPPIISGTTKSGGAYYLTAKKVINNLINLNLKIKQDITVLEPTLMYTTNNNLVFTAKSYEATINTGTYIVNIPGILNISSNKNHKATLQNVTLNLKQDSLKSDKNFIGSYNNKILKSSGISINDYGNLIIFKGPVSIKSNNSK